MRKFLALACSLVTCSVLIAGEGGIIKSDNTPIYAEADATNPVHKLNRGEFVTMHVGNISSMNYETHETKNGRVSIQYFKEQPGIQKGGWVRESDVAIFQSDNSCNQYSVPFDHAGMKNIWSTCFRHSALLAIDKMAHANFKPPEIENQAIFSAIFENAWSALIETLSDQKWQIESIDKGSGLITTKPAVDTNGSTMVCATALDEAHKTWLNIFVKTVEGGTRVKVNATFQAVREDQTISCFSNGEIEKSLFNGIKNNLPPPPPPPATASSPAK